VTLTLEEDILISAGLLPDEYDPEYELEPGEEAMTAEERKEELELARESFLEVKGRLSKIQWEGGQDWVVGQNKPGETNLTIRMIFGSLRESLPVQYVLGDMRVYCEPKQSLPGDSFKCVTINRHSPAVAHQPLTREAYVEEIAGEIRHQLREECSACKKPVEHDDEVCGACGAELNEDDEPDETPEETPATASAASSS
jgi:hypothetical protein